LLGETIRPAAIFASLFGIAGVGVIAAGRLGESGDLAASVPGIAAILASAVFYAWNLILQRQQALLSGPVEVALFQNLSSARSSRSLYPGSRAGLPPACCAT
jgi:S-adenosylmethionine uptake transporter